MLRLNYVPPLHGDKQRSIPAYTHHYDTHLKLRTPTCTQLYSQLTHPYPSTSSCTHLCSPLRYPPILTIAIPTYTHHCDTHLYSPLRYPPILTLRYPPILACITPVPNYIHHHPPMVTRTCCGPKRGKHAFRSALYINIHLTYSNSK